MLTTIKQKREAYFDSLKEELINRFTYTNTLILSTTEQFTLYGQTTRISSIYLPALVEFFQNNGLKVTEYNGTIGMGTAKFNYYLVEMV